MGASIPYFEIYPIWMFLYPTSYLLKETTENSVSNFCHFSKTCNHFLN